MFADLAHGRDNNFQLLRILAAGAVIVSHSFPIAGAPEPHFYGVTLGTIAVWVFFSVSGFLIYKSFERQPLVQFIEARVLRIYPALIVVSVLTVLVLGPLVTTDPDYFGSRETLEYVPRALSLKFVSFALPGVFAANPYPAVNGPLWTLWYEVSCYIGLAVGLSLLRSFRLFLLVYAAIFVLIRHTLYSELSLAFVTGMALYRYRNLIAARLSLAAIALVAAVAFPQAAPVAVGYSALWLAQVKGPQLSYNRLGDYSYGLYIYGWPVQELVVLALPGIGAAALIALALPTALLCAAASWYLVEKPCLELKGMAQRTSRRLAVKSTN